MIILKILLYVLLAVLGIVAAVLILALVLPATAEVSFIDGRFKYKIKFSIVSLMDSEGKGLLKRKKKKKKKNKKKKKKSEPEDFFDDSDDDYDFDDYDDYDEDFPEDDIDDIDIDIAIDEEDYEIPKEPEEPDEDSIRSEKIRKIKEKKSHKTDEDVPDEPEDNQKTIGDKIDFLLNIWDIAGRPLLKVFRGFHIKNVFIDFIVADEDAYKCAVNYGKVSCTVYNALAWLGELFTVSYKTVDVQCGFSLKKSQWDASCKVSFRLYTLVISALWFLMAYIFKILLPKKLKQRKSKK